MATKTTLRAEVRGRRRARRAGMPTLKAPFTSEFSRSPTTPVVAVIFDDEVVEAGLIPAEPHDVPVDAIVTPTRTIATTVR